MPLLRNIIFSLLFLLLASGIIADDKKEIIKQQNQLEKIKSDIKSSQKKLDDLKQNEIQIQKQLSESDQKIRTDRTIINRLNRQLNKLQKTIETTASEIRDRELMFELSQRRYLGNIRHFYFTITNPTGSITGHVNDRLGQEKQIKYLSALAHYESGNVSLASQLLEQTISDKDKLSGERKEMSRLKKNKETSHALAKTKKEKQKKSLTSIRRKETIETDRMMMLEQAAEEMERIIARIQQEAAERRHASNREATTSFFATMKGQLSLPYRGKIVSVYGNIVDPVTKLRSFSPGISIQGKAGGKVAVVSSGTVAYVGDLRGYGLFIIINHDDRYFTTYAGLGKTFVSINEYVLAGNKIGEADSKGLLKFELRDGSKPVDPVEWLRFESIR